MFALRTCGGRGLMGRWWGQDASVWFAVFLLSIALSFSAGVPIGLLLLLTSSGDRQLPALAWLGIACALAPIGVLGYMGIGNKPYSPRLASDLLQQLFAVSR